MNSVREWEEQFKGNFNFNEIFSSELTEYLINLIYNQFFRTLQILKLSTRNSSSFKWRKQLTILISWNTKKFKY